MSRRYSAERATMIEHQLRRRGLQNARLLAAISCVPRHLFVPATVRSASYDDTALPIGAGQTISQPYIVALMTDALALAGDERVLEVGTGSGYQAAILSYLAREVHTVELLPQLSARARRLAGHLHLGNIYFHVGDGSLGWPESAPYDAVIVTAAAPAVPDALMRQLAPSGRVVLPLAAADGYQVLKLITQAGGRTSERVLANVAFVPLRGQYGMQR